MWSRVHSWFYGPYSVMCGVCVDTCSCKPNENMSREQHSAKLRNVLLTPVLWNRRNNDVIHICTTITTTNLQRCPCTLPRQWKVHLFIVHGTFELHMCRKMFLDLKNNCRIWPWGVTSVGGHAMGRNWWWWGINAWWRWIWCQSKNSCQSSMGRP